MPFDYEEYQKKCNTLTTEQLHKEWENYTRQISGGATSTATSVLFSPLTAGISLVGLGLSAPRIHNARKKREIIEAGLQARGTSHNTRKRDVLAPMVVAGTLGGLTLGLAGPGADMIAGAAVGHGMEYAVSHAALDATGAVIEHGHDEHSKQKADEKLKLQYQNFQQQYLQEQENLQGLMSHLSPQPGLQFIPPAPQHSRPGTTQPGQTQLSNPNPGLQMPPPIPQHSRPETLQPGQIPSYQPQFPDQDQKYEYVPIPAAHSSSISYQPVSHQQQNVQSLPVAQRQTINSVPQYEHIQQPEKYLATVSSQAGNVSAQTYFPEKTTTYTSTAPQNELPGPSSCPSPLAQYSSKESAPISQSNPQEFPFHTSTSTGINPGAHPNMHVDLPSAPPTMEEDILFLKARLIQLELEKREAAAQQASSTLVQPTVQNTAQPIGLAVSKQESQPSLTLTRPSVQQPQSTTSSQQFYPPPPASPALPPRSPSIAPETLPPPPPPLPLAQTTILPPPPQSYTYQPQSYPLPPPSPNAQQQPRFQRIDSGYHSNAPTPSPSNRLSQSYIPNPNGYPSPSQGTGTSQHSHNPSISSYQPSPMSPAPSPYGSGLSVVPTGSGKDYFGQGVPPSSPNSGGAQHYQRNNMYGTQGWQWGTSATQFPPPPPSQWRG